MAKLAAAVADIGERYPGAEVGVKLDDAGYFEHICALQEDGAELHLDLSGERIPGTRVRHDW